MSYHALQAVCSSKASVARAVAALEVARAAEREAQQHLTGAVRLKADFLRAKAEPGPSSSHGQHTAGNCGTKLLPRMHCRLQELEQILPVLRREVSDEGVSHPAVG